MENQTAVSKIAEAQRRVVEMRIINLCTSRAVKESVMRDIDLLCELVVRDKGKK